MTSTLPDFREGDHFVNSGGSKDKITTTCSSFGVGMTGNGFGATGCEASCILKTAPFKLSAIFVPMPSFAKTEPLTNTIEAIPSAFALNVMRSNAPSEPVKPGLGKPPVKLIAPAELSQVG